MRNTKGLRLSAFDFEALMCAPLIFPDKEKVPRDLTVGGADEEGQIRFEARRSDRPEDEKRRKDHAKENVQNAG